MPHFTSRRRGAARVGLLLAALLFPACGRAVRSGSPERGTAPARITQVSTINALLVGRYDGSVTLRDLRRWGDFGIGTFDQLDGEMILLDGRVYQAAADGSVREPGLDLRTPFATVVPFRAESAGPLPPTEDLRALEAELDARLPDENAFVAIRVEGEFASLTLRSVPRQTPPYAPLAEAAKAQSLWSRRDVAGTLVGLRCPAWTSGINVPGYHWHFLSRDRRLGGHVIEAAAGPARFAAGTYRGWLVELGPPRSLAGADLRQDLRGDLERVERSRGEPR